MPDDPGAKAFHFFMLLWLFITVGLFIRFRRWVVHGWTGKSRLARRIKRMLPREEKCEDSINISSPDDLPAQGRFDFDEIRKYQEIKSKMTIVPGPSPARPRQLKDMP